MSIILSIVMFSFGIAAGYIYWQGDRSRLMADLKAKQEEIDDLRRSYRSLKGDHYKLVKERYYRR